MSALKPGLYRATVRGVADQIVMIHRNSACTAEDVADWVQHDLDNITDARPLIVLDLGDVDHDTFLSIWRDSAQALRGAAADRDPYYHDLLSILADQIEAQTKSPRIPEPDWGEFVSARTPGNGHERKFLRYKTDDPDFRWADGVEQYRWTDLLDPTLIREGLS